MRSIRAISALLEKTKQLGHFCAKADVLFYSLPWLMVLTVLGTLAQKNMGVYEATEKYFNSLNAPLKELIWFENSAHAPPFEEPEKFNRIILNIAKQLGIK